MRNCFLNSRTGYVAFTQFVFGACPPVVTFVGSVVLASAGDVFAFYRTFESAVIVSTVGIEGKLVRSIIGKLLRKVIRAVAQGERGNRFDDVFSIFCQTAVLPPSEWSYL